MCRITLETRCSTKWPKTKPRRTSGVSTPLPAPHGYNPSRDVVDIHFFLIFFLWRLVNLTDKNNWKWKFQIISWRVTEKNRFDFVFPSLDRLNFGINTNGDVFYKILLLVIWHKSGFFSLSKCRFFKIALLYSLIHFS